jgi:rare lipoprotein A
MERFTVPAPSRRARASRAWRGSSLRALLVVTALLAPHAARARAHEPARGACEPYPRRVARADAHVQPAKRGKSRRKSDPMTGVASYYGREFNHRRTANGERYLPTELTAAHRWLPFGTRLRVTNLDNGRRVVVRVNDRGPYAKGRVLDLSRAAAGRLGILDRGLAHVRLEVLSPKRPKRDPLAEELDERERGARPSPRRATRKGPPGRA